MLPMFTGSHLVPQPKWGYGVAQQYIQRLQPLRNVVQWLLRGRLMGTDLMQTFVRHRVQPL
jgi:hypothetical protein